MKEVAQRTEQAKKSAQQTKQTDAGSAVGSVTSKKSLRAQTSSTHSVMLKIEMEHAALQNIGEEPSSFFYRLDGT